jgi:hypothetical protein
MTRARRRSRSLVLVAATVMASAGCYRYTAIPVADVRPLEDVLVHVTYDAAVRVGPYLGVIRENI